MERKFWKVRYLTKSSFLDNEPATLEFADIFEAPTKEYAEYAAKNWCGEEFIRPIFTDEATKEEIEDYLNDLEVEKSSKS